MGEIVFNFVILFGVLILTLILLVILFKDRDYKVYRTLTLRGWVRVMDTTQRVLI